MKSIQQDVKAEALAAEEAAVYNWHELRKLKDALDDVRRDHAVLVLLVERMGADLATALGARNSYTVIGQREYDAAIHEAEGAPPDAGMLEAVQ